MQLEKNGNTLNIISSLEFKAMSVFGRKGLMSQTLWAYEVESDDGGIFSLFGIVFWSLTQRIPKKYEKCSLSSRSS